MLALLCIFIFLFPQEWRWAVHEQESSTDSSWQSLCCHTGSRTFGRKAEPWRGEDQWWHRELSPRFAFTGTLLKPTFLSFITEMIPITKSSLKDLKKWFFSPIYSFSSNSKTTKRSFPSCPYKSLWLGRDHISVGKSKSRQMRRPGCGSDSTSFLREWHAFFGLQVSV